MSAKSESIVKSLLESIQSPSKETQPYDTSATVTRVEDDTVFVHIPGGVAETPCSKTISCKVGDTVQVRVGGGKAWLVGNASAPPTDDTTANTAIRKTNQLGDSLTKLQKIAGNTDQYFWHVETGEDTGSHITEIPKERFLEAPALGGGNLLLRSNGIAIRNGLNELATFSGSAIQFNQPGTNTVVATIGTSGLYIQKGVIKLGNKTSASDTTNSGTYIDANGNMATSNIKVHGGEIGGWTINASTLSRVNGSYTLSLDSEGLTISSSSHSAWYHINSILVSAGNSVTFGVDNTAMSYSGSNNNGVWQYPYGAMLVQRTDSDAIVRCTCFGHASDVSLDAAPSGNRGIWDYTGGAWIIYKNSSNQVRTGQLYIDGNVEATNGVVHMGDAYTDAAHLSCVWTDGSHHDLITREASTAEARFGYSSAALRLRGTSYKFADGSTISSDRNVKTDIAPLDKRYEDFYDSLQPRQFKLVNGMSGRTHTGYVAQDVRDALLEADLTTTDFGGYVVDKITEQDRDSQDERSDVNYCLDHGHDEIHQLRYSEFIALNTWQIQKLKARVAELEAKHG